MVRGSNNCENLEVGWLEVEKNYTLLLRGFDIFFPPMIMRRFLTLNVLFFFWGGLKICTTLSHEIKGET